MSTAQNSLENGLYLTPIFPYNDRIVDSILTRKNTVQRKPMLWYILRSGPFPDTAQEMKLSIKDFFSKCDRICSFLNGKFNFLRKGSKTKIDFILNKFYQKHK